MKKRNLSHGSDGELRYIKEMVINAYYAEEVIAS